MQKSFLSEALLKTLYVDLRKTDKEIANFFNIDRTTVVHRRKLYRIPARSNTGRQGELLVAEELRKLGYNPIDMNIHDKLSDFDILVDGQIKIEVKSSQNHSGCFRFILTEKESNQNIVSNTRIRLNNGRTKKNFMKTCDIIVFVGIDGEDISYWVVPSKDISVTQQSIAIPVSRKGKYRHYFNNWDLLKRWGGDTCEERH